MKKIIAFVIVVLLIISSYFVYQKYETNKFISLVAPHLKNTSLRVTNQIGYELASNTKITFKEIFTKYEDDIAEMDKRTLEIQTATNDKNKLISLPAVEYIKACQTFSRSILDFNRKTLQKRNAYEWATTQLDSYQTAVGSYSNQYAKQSAEKAIEDFKKAVEELKVAYSDVHEAASTLKAAREEAFKKYSDDVLVSSDKLDEIIKNFSPNDEKPDVTPTSVDQKATEADLQNAIKANIAAIQNQKSANK